MGWTVWGLIPLGTRGFSFLKNLQTDLLLQSRVRASGAVPVLMWCAFHGIDRYSFCYHSVSS
jgi:hypothetical protein